MPAMTHAFGNTGLSHGGSVTIERLVHQPGRPIGFASRAGKDATDCRVRVCGALEAAA